MTDSARRSVIAWDSGVGTPSEIALAPISGMHATGLEMWEAHHARREPAASFMVASQRQAVDLAQGTGLPGQDGGI
jgi:hypothetical protein